MASFRWGTSSWSDKSWVGSFYPAGTRPADFLPIYAQTFDTVEADTTYYAVPDERVVRGWEGKLPPGFLMAAKFPRSIVHAGEGAQPDVARVLAPRPDDETPLFLERMALLGPKCGPLVLQFPWFRRGTFRGLPEFLDRLAAYLDRLPPDFRYAVEVRNRDWIGDELLSLLRGRRVPLVLVEMVNLPHPADLARRLDLVTGDFVYARLIGDRKLVDSRTERFDRIVVDRGDSIARWAELLREYGERVPETLAFANNHYAGHGPATIRELQRLVEGTA